MTWEVPSHLTSITKLNDEVASLNAQLKTCKNDFNKLKFARDAYTVGRHPIPNKEKGKAPMASSSQKNHAFMYHDRKYFRDVHYNRSYNAFDSHAMIASSSNFNGRPRRNIVSHAPRKVCNKPTTVFHTCNTTFVLSCKNKRWLLKRWGPNARETRHAFGSLRPLLLTL